MLNVDTFRENITKEQLFQPGDRLILAVSGGVDSTVLCALCAQSGYSFEMAHANFQLRGEESDKDEQCVRENASHYQATLHVKVFNTLDYAEKNKVSIQVAARELRYAWFEQLIKGKREWLLTGHHAGDAIETMLINFFRGTGIRGLHGILPKQKNIIRPLLPFTREDILRFAKENALSWREDESNSSVKYTRNFFRHNIIPMVAAVYPAVESNLSDNISRFREVEELYDQSIGRYKESLLVKKGNEWQIPVLKLRKCRPLSTIVYEIIKEFGFSATQVNEVIHLLDGEQSGFVMSATHRIIRNRKWLIIARNDSMEAEHILIEEGTGQLEFRQGVLTLKKIPVNGMKMSPDPAVAFIDAREVSFPLVLRRWKTGDYFYPLGLAKKKKISRFLIDQKISPTAKERVWVLESDHRICWVAGMRIDHRFRMVDSTKDVWRIELKADDVLPDP